MFQAKTPEVEKKSHPKRQFLGTVKLCLGKKKKSEEEESGQEEIEKVHRAGVAISIRPWESIRIPPEIQWESTETL